MANNTFEPFRDSHLDAHKTTSSEQGWCICAGYDPRGYTVMLQQTKGELEPMVRVGCRYMTLREARKHYVSRGRNDNHWRRTTSRHMLALIGVAVETAKYIGCLDDRVKFNTTPRKVRR
jgi:hypothetical protein